MRLRLRGRLPAALAVLAASAALPPADAFAIDPNDVSKLSSGPSGPTTAHISTGGLGELGRLVLGLLVVIAVIGGAYFLLRRASRARLPGARRGSGNVEVLETTQLTPTRHLHVVRVGDRVLLLGATDHGITTLESFDRDAALAEGLLDDGAVAPEIADALAPASAAAQRRGMLDLLRERTAR